jgi:hypothetical protein
MKGDVMTVRYCLFLKKSKKGPCDQGITPLHLDVLDLLDAELPQARERLKPMTLGYSGIIRARIANTYAGCPGCGIVYGSSLHYYSCMPGNTSLI